MKYPLFPRRTNVYAEKIIAKLLATEISGLNRSVQAWSVFRTAIVYMKQQFFDNKVREKESQCFNKITHLDRLR